MPTTLTEIRAALENSELTRNDTHQLYEAMRRLSSQGRSASFPSELFVLCCEVALKQELWDVAKRCLAHFVDGKVASPSLQARSYYCEAAVRLHDIPPSLRGQQWVSERQVCASSVLRGISVAVAEYPNDGWVLTLGLDHLWNVLAPVYEAGKHKDIVDVVGFVVAIFERLITSNFEYTRLQWLFRYAVCFRGLGRFADALTQLYLCLELAARLENDRLLVQILRFTATTTFERDAQNPKGNKGESIFTKHPVFQAIYASQLLLCGYAEADSVKGELLAAQEKLSVPDKTPEGATGAATSTTATARPKSKATRTNALDAVSVSPPIVEEVLADVVLALALSAKEARVALPAAEKLCGLQSPRCKTFGMYAKILVRSQQEALLDLSDAIDVSYLDAHMVQEIKRSLREVESAMGTARMIEDASERAYTLQVGCTLLWALCLPLLQEDTLGSVRQTVHKVCRTLKETPSLYTQTKFFVDVTYESCLADFSEDNLTHLAQRIFAALQRDYAVVLDHDKLSYPMDFPLLWLLRRTQARTQIDSSQFLLPEEEALFNLEQSKIVATATKRIVLIKAAFNKLPPFPSFAPPPSSEGEGVAEAGGPLKRKQSAIGHRGGGKFAAAAPDPAAQPAPFIPLSLAELYVSLMRECMKDLHSSLLPIAKSTAKTLSELPAPVEERYKDILLLKAEGLQCLVEVLLAEQASEDATATALASAASDASVAAAAIPHLLQAASVGHSLSALGVPSLHIVVNAAQTALRVCRSLVTAGRLDGLSAKFAEMHQFVVGAGISCRHEAALVVELTVLYVMALLFDYMKQKGDALQRADGEPLSYDELVAYAVKFGKVDSSSAVLKRAQDVCWDIMQRVPSPAAKAPLCLLYPTVCRLHGMNKMEAVAHPQEQLMSLLGRLLGPVSFEEKSALVSKDALALLKEDPSVELCGRMVDLAVACKDERTALEVCDIADGLYRQGKLGWGTLFAVSRKETTAGNPNAAPAAAKGGPMLVNTNAPFPKPTESDWMWYAHLLYTHATLFKDRMQGMDLSSQHQLGLRIVQQTTNSAIAASHGAAFTRVRQIAQALTLYYEVVGRLINTSCEKTLLFPSLKMMLSRSIQSHLSFSSSNRHNDESQERLLGIITTLGRWLLQSCPTVDTLKEGIRVVADLTKVLPTKFHSQFCVEEVTARAKLGFPVDGVLRVAKSSSAQAEALAWMALATVTEDQKQAQEGWRRALVAADAQPLMKATVLTHFASYCLQKSALSLLDIQRLLLSALDVLHVDFASAPTTHTATSFPHYAGSTGKSAGHSGEGGGGGMQGTLHKTRLQDGALHPTSSLNETLCAIRAVYLLFSITEDVATAGKGPIGESACEMVTTRSQQHSSPVKLDCMLLLLRFVESLWQTVDENAREVFGCSAEDASGEGRRWYEAHAIPQHTVAWFGYVLDTRLVRVVSAEGAVDTAQNTEAMQEIYFSVIEYLLEHNMELFVFSVGQWAYLMAALRYGETSFHTDLVRQCVLLYCQKAACLCNAGRKGVQLYALPASTLSYWALVEDGLAQVQPLDATARLPMDGVHARPFAGSLHDIVMRKAQLVFYFGDTAKAERYARALYRLCERVDDPEGRGRCLLLMAKCDTIRGDYTKALEMLQSDAVVYASSSLSHPLFMELMLQRIDLLLAVGKTEAAASELASVQAMIRSERQKAEGISSVRGSLHTQAAGHMEETLYRYVALHWVELSRCGVLAMPSLTQPPPSSLAHQVQAYLHRSPKWKNRLLALQLALRTDECIDHAWILQKGKDIEACSRLFSLLKERKSFVERLLDDLHHDISLFVPLFNGTVGSALTPSLQTVVSRLLLCKADLLSKVQLVADRVLRGYRSMTMADLQLPTTDAPQELTDKVLQYMRDPSESNAEHQEMARMQQEWVQPTFALTKELTNALQHYSITYEENDLTDASRFGILELLLSAAETVAGGHHPSYFDALQSVIRCEYQKSFELSVGPRATADDSRHVTFLEAAVDEVWRKSALPVHIAAATTAGTKSRPSKVSVAPMEEPRPLSPFGHPLCGQMLYLEKACLDVIRHAELRCSFSTASRVYLQLADLYVLWGRLQAAGCAIEHAQGANIMQRLFDTATQFTATTEEGSLARRFTRLIADQEELLDTDYADTLYEKWSQSSPMVSLFAAASEWGPAPDHVEPAVLDGVVLTMVNSADCSSVFVSLRQPDGVVHVRRLAIDWAGVQSWRAAFAQFLQEQRERLLARCPAASVKDEKDGSRLRVEDVSEKLEALEALLYPLFADFAEYMKVASTKFTLYLCLDATFQPLPIDHLPCFSAFHTISRELTPSLLMRKANTKAAKYSNATLYVVDPFGDVPSAVETVMGTDAKVKSGTVLTCTDGKYPLQPSYLSACMEDARSSSVLLFLCGPLSSVLTYERIARAALEHIQTAALFTDGVCESAVRRALKNERMHGKAGLLEEPWVAALLLLTRGVRCVCMNSFPSSSGALLNTAKRAANGLSSGKSMADCFSASTVKGKEGKYEWTMFFGSFTGSSRKK